MSHWAEIDQNNIVINVTVGDNNDPAGDEGYSWLVENLGGTWIKASYNTINGIHTLGGTPLRHNYPSPGFLYIEHLDIFMPPKPFESWSLDENNKIWKAPIARPIDRPTIWNEELLSWEDVPKPYNSWIFNNELLIWDSPVAHPNDGNDYEWSEELENWVQV